MLAHTRCIAVFCLIACCCSAQLFWLAIFFDVSFGDSPSTTLHSMARHCFFFSSLGELLCFHWGFCISELQGLSARDVSSGGTLCSCVFLALCFRPDGLVPSVSFSLPTMRHSLPLEGYLLACGLYSRLQAFCCFVFRAELIRTVSWLPLWLLFLRTHLVSMWPLHQCAGLVDVML